MKNTFAIAIAKARKKAGAIQPEPHQSREIDEELSRTGLGLFFVAGAIVGVTGFLFLLSGLIRSGGVVDLLRGLLVALGGS